MGLVEELKKRVLLLDGGLGTMIQKYGFTESDYRGREFLSHQKPLSGLNDILNLTKPSSIKKIHEAYLDSGCDIITSNTFNSNKISLADYGLENDSDLIRRINREGVSIAKEAIEDYRKRNSGNNPLYVAGSIGPTNRSASMSPDISNPEKRNVTYDDLFEGYEVQIEGLIEGGADILLFETFYDTLNLKAGLAAAQHVMHKLDTRLPIMVSATISDKSGHILSGQTLEAFITTINDFEGVISIGLNCGFGPEDMSSYLEVISKYSNHYISCHPNAGLPDETGCYKMDPEDFKDKVAKLLETSLLNIIGGCCGTTPEHIFRIKKLVNEIEPYTPKELKEALRLAGNDVLIKKGHKDFMVVGERCNVAGSRKFLRLIKENNLEEASEIAKKEIEAGAEIIDINMDDPLLDSQAEMIKFIRYINSEPEVAKVPYMIDSSKWEVIENGLKNIQGKGIVNSLSLKEGEEEFIRKAGKVKELGFSLIVMAFDEKGQADTYKRKIEICERAYRLLTEKCGYKPDDIIFDVNIMAIATGIPEHSKYGIEFIRAVEWVKKNLPGVKTSGGVSNLSFSFRGKNKIREYIHSIFLHHAVASGLDMAIVNPGALPDYYSIPENIRNIIEDVLLTGDQKSEAMLLDLVLDSNPEKSNEPIEEKRKSLSVEERLKEDMVKGDLLHIKDDLEEALSGYDEPLKIIDGPLMDGMKTVGDLFGEGKMYLPQVVKTARAMNVAVDFLKPYIDEKKNDENSAKTGKIVIATVKGDVHDIGKNIVATVLSCNNFEVIDLGVMVPSQEIIEKIKEENPDILCLSGLITPSLTEMANVVDELEKEGINIPAMVGGAATSGLHTLLHISPKYSGVVIHMNDASQNPIAAKKLLGEESRKSYLEELEKKNREIKESLSEKNQGIVSFKEATEKGRNRTKTSD